jgi:hypothetical protein
VDGFVAFPPLRQEQRRRKDGAPSLSDNSRAFPRSQKRDPAASLRAGSPCRERWSRSWGPRLRGTGLLFLDDPYEGAVRKFAFEQMNHAILYVALEFLSRGT